MPDLGHKPSLARATIQCHLPQKGPSLSSIWHPLSVHACDELSQSWMSATDLQTLCLGTRPSLCPLQSGESEGPPHPCLADLFCSGPLKERGEVSKPSRVKGKGGWPIALRPWRLPSTCEM